MTSATRALELFLRRPTGANRIDWLANQLLALAAEARFLSMRILPNEAGDGWTFETSDSGHVVSSQDPGPLRVFRTLLARLAKMGEEETGVEFNPYGGKLSFERASPTGPVRIDVEF